MSPHIRKWHVLTIVSIALFLIVMDMTVLYTALPQLTHDLAASASMKLWIINAYTLVVAGLLLSTGALGDRLGYRPVFTIGLLVFAIASLCAAFAPSAAALVAARALKGVGAALMMPATLAIIRLSFTDVRERSVAIGIWASIASGGAAMGPVIGGILLEYFWWGSVFLINVPIALLAIVLTRIYVPDIRKPAHDLAHAWDYLSSLLALVALVSLVVAIKELAKPTPWLAALVCAASVAVVSTVLFVRRQQRLAAPLVDFRLFRNPAFSSGVIAAIVASVALIGVELVFSQRLQLVVGLSPLQAALVILPIPLAAFVAGPLTGWLLARWSTRSLLLIGLGLTALSLIGLGLSLNVQGPTKLAVLTLLGLGVGATITAASNAVMNNAPPQHAGMAASIEEVSYEVGGVLGIALLGTVLSWHYQQALQIPAALGAAAQAGESIDTTLLAAESLPGTAAQQLIGLAHAAFDQAFSTVMVAAVLIVLAACVAVLAMRQRAPTSHTVG